MSYEIKIEETAFTDVDFSDVSSFTFKEYHFILKRQPFIKHCFGRGRTNGIDRDDIVNFKWFTKTIVDQWGMWEP